MVNLHSFYDFINAHVFVLSDIFQFLMKILKKNIFKILLGTVFFN